MLLKSYKNILPALVAVMGGIMFAVGQPEIVLANNKAEFTPSGPSPKTTKGAGSRLYLKVFLSPTQSQSLQNHIL